MSRRHNLSYPYYGQIKLKCPRGHPVGAIHVQPRRPAPGQIQSFRKLSAVLRAPEIEELPGGKLESVETSDYEGRMERGKTVEANCEICGRPYWTFWERVPSRSNRRSHQLGQYRRPHQPNRERSQGI